MFKILHYIFFMTVLVLTFGDVFQIYLENQTSIVWREDWENKDESEDSPKKEKEEKEKEEKETKKEGKDDKNTHYYQYLFPYSQSSLSEINAYYIEQYLNAVTLDLECPPPKF